MSAEHTVQEQLRPGFPSRLNMVVGSEARFSLESRAGAGYVWQVSNLAGDQEAALLRIESGPAPEQGTTPSNLPPPTQLVVSGRHAGTARWRVRLLRPWMPDHPLVDQVIEVFVGER